MKQKTEYVIGIDEAGRGPLAGPVTVAALIMPRSLKIQKSKLADSKKLSVKQREEWFKYIKEHPDIYFATASVSAKTIDMIGISKALRIAISRSLTNLENIKHRVFDIFKEEVLLDGLLQAPAKYKNQKTIIKGDEKIPAISLASIVAKVTRDKKMICLAKKYPQYGFEIHKGYGTKLHYGKIKKYGVSREHRKTYLHI